MNLVSSLLPKESGRCAGLPGRPTFIELRGAWHFLDWNHVNGLRLDGGG